jgi:arsenate reductase-like glutaredoxin family protein
MFVENQDIINKPIIIDEDEVQKAYQQQIPQQQFQGYGI